MKKINLCPHPVDVVRKDGAIESFPKSGVVARCEQFETVVGEIDGIEITEQDFGPVKDLPAPQEDTVFIVSRIVADRCPNREDLLIPGPLLRDDDGNVIGCKGLSKPPRH